MLAAGAHGRLDAQDAGVGVELGGRAERQGREVAAVADRQAVQARHAQRGEQLVEHLVDRQRVRVGIAAHPRVAVDELADEHAGDPVQQSGGQQLGEHLVDPPGRLAEVIHPQQRAVEIELPGSADQRLDE